MNPYTTYLIVGLIGMILAIFGFFAGALLARHSYKEIGEERYRQGYNAGARVGWYDAADELDNRAQGMVGLGLVQRAATWKAAARHLSKYWDTLDGGRR